MTQEQEDVEVGRMVREAVERLKTDRKSAMITETAARLLIGFAHDLNAEESEITMNGVTRDRQPIGDWLITVRRVKEAKGGRR